MAILRVVAIVFLCIGAVWAQTPGDLDETFMPPVSGVQPQGTNYSGVIAIAGGKLFVYGEVQGTFGGIARLHADGTVDPSFAVGSGAQRADPMAKANVTGLQVLPDARLLLNGNFTSFNGVAAPGLVRLQADGAVDTSFQAGVNIQPEVVRLLSDGRIILQNWDRQLYLLKSDGAQDGPNPQFAQLFFPRPILATANGGYLVEHSLVFTDEVNAEGRLALVSAGGSLSREVTWGGSFPVIEGVGLPDGRFLVWGRFSEINDRTVTNLAILQPDLTVDPQFRCAVSGYVGAAEVASDGSITLVGDFNAVNGMDRLGVARVSLQGVLDTGFAPAGFDVARLFQRTGITLQGSRTVVTGGFSEYQGHPRRGILALLENGALDPDFPGSTTPGGPDNGVSALARTPQGGYFLAGSFTEVGSVPARSLVRITVDGLVDTNFNVGSGFNGPVFALAALTNGGVIAGGQFTAFNGQPAGSIVRLNSDGSRDTNFTTTPGFQGQSATVAALALLPDGRVMVGGQFSTYNGTSRDGIARLMADGSLDGTFNPGTGISSPTNRIILGITLLPTGKMLVNGRFLNYNGVNRGHAARLNNNGTLDTSFTGGANDFIRCLAVMSDGRIVVAGGFSRSIGVDQSRVARWHPDGALDTSFNAGLNLDGPVRGMALQPDGRVIVGGLFRNYGTTPRAGIARLNQDGTLDTTFDPGTGLAASAFSPTIEAMLLQDDFAVILAGGFETYDGRKRPHVARVFTGTPPAASPALETRRLADGRLEIRWPEVPGFSLESASSPDTLLWQPVADVPPAENGQRSYVINPGGPGLFYRLRK